MKILPAYYYLFSSFKEFKRRCKYFNKTNAAKKVQKITGENLFLLKLDILWCDIKYGTFDEDYIRYEFYRKNSRERKRWLTSNINYHYMLDKMYDGYAMEVFDNKALFDKVFQSYMKHEILIAAESNETEIRDFINKHKQVIIKPAEGALGMGIYKLKSDNKELVDTLLSKIAKGEKIIIEELIVQHPDMARLNPTSVNTIRVITMLDKNGGVQILNTVAMLGADNGCVSNTHSGGCLCHIDFETGIIDHIGTNVEGQKFLKHPVTDVLLPGYQIPNWNGLAEYVKDLAKVVPSARYIGWDIVILENGYDVIEGNIHPGPGHQATDGVGRYEIIKSML